MRRCVPLLLCALLLAACVRLGFKEQPVNQPKADQTTTPTDGGAADGPGDGALTPDLGPQPDSGPPSLSAVWAKRLGSDSFDRGSRVAVDSSGNSYLVGSFSKTVDFGGGAKTSKGGSDVFVASYDASGNHRWSKTFGSTQNDYCTGVDVDSAGNVHIAGDAMAKLSFGGDPVDTLPFVASFTPGGDYRWSTGGTAGLITGYYGNLALDGSGNAFVTGYFSSSMQFGTTTLTAQGKSDIFVAGVTSTGGPRWAQAHGGPDDNEGCSVATDSAGNVYVAGSTSGSFDLGGGTATAQGWGEPFLASYTPAGAHRWSTSFACPDSGIGWSVATDSAGNVYVLGDFSGTGDFGGTSLTATDSTDVFVASFTSSGTPRWARRFGGTDWDEGRDIAVGPGDALYLTGAFSSEIDFGGGPLTAQGSSNIFVALLAGTGDHLWSRGFGGAASAGGNGIAVDAQGNVHVTGDFSGTISLGGQTHTSSGLGSDAFLLKLSPK